MGFNERPIIKKMHKPVGLLLHLSFQNQPLHTQFAIQEQLSLAVPNEWAPYKFLFQSCPTLGKVSNDCASFDCHHASPHRSSQPPFSFGPMHRDNVPKTFESKCSAHWSIGHLKEQNWFVRFHLKTFYACFFVTLKHLLEMEHRVQHHFY